MDREPLLRLLEEVRPRLPGDAARIESVRRFVLRHPDCLARSCRPGHVTASAWVLSPDRRRVLLTHHRKLGRWLQLGGHADGDPDVLAVALREAHEESGLPRIAPLPGPEGALPVDVDVHEIPARAGEPAHLHHDVRFLLVADRTEPLRVSDESHALRWVEPAELPSLGADASLIRLGAQVGARLAELGAPPGARG